MRYLRAASLGVIAALGVTSLTGCLWENGPGETTLDPATALLLQGREALAANDPDEALGAFQDLSTYDGQACNATYGMLLAHIQEAAGRVDQLLDAAALVVGAPPGARLQPQQDYSNLLRSVLDPFEAIFAQIRATGLEVIDGNCIFSLPEGFPIELGSPNSLIYLRIELGYEWDEPIARAIVAVVDALQALIDYLLAHRLELEEFEEPLNDMADAFDRIGESEIVNGQPATYTYIGLLRTVGVLFDINPFLLTFGAEADRRIGNVDNSLGEMFQMIYARDSAGETGIVPALLVRARADTDVSDNVLGMIDNGDGEPGSGDTLVLGVRALNLAGSFALPDNAGGVAFTFNEAFGNFNEIVRNLHDMVDVLGDQMAAVDDPSHAWRRLGFQEINNIIGNIKVFGIDDLPPLPEAVELDLRAYYSDPLPVRDLLPFWYDDDNNVESGDVFMIEGESAVTAAEPWVYVGDAPHFPALFTFDSLGESAVEIDDVSIPTDLVTAAQLELELPFPYIAWQHPSFGGALWIDPTVLPVAPQILGPEDAENGYFAPATQYTANKALNEYLYYFVDQQEIGGSLLGATQ